MLSLLLDNIHIHNMYVIKLINNNATLSELFQKSKIQTYDISYNQQNMEQCYTDDQVTECSKEIEHYDTLGK